MKKGLVLAVDERHATILTEEMEYKKIKTQPGHAPGKRVVWSEEDLAGRPGLFRRSPGHRKAGALGLLGVLVLGLALLGVLALPGLEGPAGTFRTTPAFAVVTVDINPSLELLLDRECRVLEARALNGDGEALLASMPPALTPGRHKAGSLTGVLKGLELEEAMDLLLDAAEEQGYLLEEGAVLVTSTILEIAPDMVTDAVLPEAVLPEATGKAVAEADPDGLLEERVTDYVASRQDAARIYYSRGNKVEREEAKALEISLGRYKMARALEDSLTLEETLEMSISELARSYAAVRGKKEGQDRDTTGDSQGTGAPDASSERVGEENPEDPTESASEGEGRDAAPGQLNREETPADKDDARREETPAGKDSAGQEAEGKLAPEVRNGNKPTLPPGQAAKDRQPIRSGLEIQAEKAAREAAKEAAEREAREQKEVERQAHEKEDGNKGNGQSGGKGNKGR
ncbi:anti-sigma-I factor RsgI family protein [Anaerotalea alkaliphila]|uniref:RsgI N-terminal anti-sigma domain-containing protein n=1 Tax=Anaerotalea alkaliphila TaxID=2662126 RepID=A0A7X5KNA4_9FIRM|nr:anti-sigma factor domain-containing protein [Anaerotalea alkaliphila]NDL67829.1 hypothetical protein [Anaerotalea alkaliphila]